MITENYKSKYYQNFQFISSFHNIAVFYVFIDFMCHFIDLRLSSNFKIAFLILILIFIKNVEIKYYTYEKFHCLIMYIYTI